MDDYPSPQNQQNEAEISWGDKKARIRGSDILVSIVGMIVAAGLSLIIYTLFDHNKQTHEFTESMQVTFKEMVQEQKEVTTALRENTCLLSIPQEKREQEFQSPNGICKRLSRLR
jgi:hypothetical protein